MRKFYETKPVLFAILWIVVYVVLIAPLRGRFGDGSLQMLLGLVAISAALLAAIRLLGIQKELGMTRWLQNGRALLWLLPMWVLSTGNLWGGVSLRYDAITSVMAVLCKICTMRFKPFLQLCNTFERCVVSIVTVCVVRIFL